MRDVEQELAEPLLGADHPVVAGRTDRAPLLLAAAGRAAPRTPVWFMRQAGRSLPEYRRIREGTGMLEACRTPDLVVEITDQPVRRHGVDAAILFSDIVVPLQAVGIDLDIVPGVGPVVADPIRDAAGVPRISLVWPSNCGSASRTVTTAVAPSSASSLPIASSLALSTLADLRWSLSVFTRARSKPARWVPPLGVATMLTNERTSLS